MEHRSCKVRPWHIFIITAQANNFPDPSLFLDLLAPAPGLFSCRCTAGLKTLSSSTTSLKTTLPHRAAAHRTVQFQVMEELTRFSKPLVPTNHPLWGLQLSISSGPSALPNGAVVPSLPQTTSMHGRMLDWPWGRHSITKSLLLKGTIQPRALLVSLLVRTLLTSGRMEVQRPFAAFAPLDSHVRKGCSNRKGIFAEYYTCEIDVVARSHMNCL
jgi:hypothetical protein